MKSDNKRKTFVSLADCMNYYYPKGSKKPKMKPKDFYLSAIKLADESYEKIAKLMRRKLN